MPETDDTVGEVWKPIPGYEGAYEASSRGRVKSLARRIHIEGRGVRPVRERILRTYLAGPLRNTAYVCLSGGGEARPWMVHRLVLMAFRGPAPAGTEGCHRNDVKADNRIENLYWGTRAENVADRTANGGDTVGTRHPNCRLTEAAVREIRSDYAAGGVTQADLGARHGVHRDHISMIVTRRRWRHLI